MGSLNIWKARRRGVVVVVDGKVGLFPWFDGSSILLTTLRCWKRCNHSNPFKSINNIRSYKIKHIKKMFKWCTPQLEWRHLIFALGCWPPLTAFWSSAKVMQGRQSMYRHPLQIARGTTFMLLPAALKYAKEIRLHFFGNAADQSSILSAFMWCHTVCKAPLFLKSALFFVVFWLESSLDFKLVGVTFSALFADSGNGSKSCCNGFIYYIKLGFIASIGENSRKTSWQNSSLQFPDYNGHINMNPFDTHRFEMVTC